MSFYTVLAGNAERLIRDKGRSITIRNINNGTYNPLTNSFTGAGTTETSVKAVSSEYKINEIDGEIVKHGDKKFLIPASAQISKNDIIIDDGEYSVIDIEVVKPGDSAVIFIVQARK